MRSSMIVSVEFLAGTYIKQLKKFVDKCDCPVCGCKVFITGDLYETCNRC